MNKKLIKTIIFLWISFITILFFMSATRHVYLTGNKNEGTQKEIIKFFAELAPNIFNYYSISKPIIIENTSNFKNGFYYSNKYQRTNDYLLTSSWDDHDGQAVVKLVRISDGMVIKKWAPDINSLNKIYNNTITNGVKNNLSKNRTPLLHPLLLNDGSLIFSAGCIFKIDKDSKIIWNNTTPSHHSIERGTDGNIWICSYNTMKNNSEKYNIADDVIKKISIIDGKTIFEKSIYEILLENGYNRGNFFINPLVSINETFLDCTHLNDVQPVFIDSKYWKKDDLFLSLRHQNMVLLYRPSTNKIIWSQIGPWLRQHDVDIIDSNRIGIFGNNVIDAQFGNEKDRLIDGYNQQYIYDFSKQITSTPYDNLFSTSNIGTYTGGRSKILENGDIFIEETDRGRILYGNVNGEIWSYSEHIGHNKCSQFMWSRYISEEESKQMKFINEVQK